MASRRSEDSKEEKAKIKEEEAALKWLRFNLKCRSTTLQGQTVDFFVGSKAVDKLLESPWTRKPNSSCRNRPYFPQRKAAEKFLSRKLHGRYFYRGLKVEKKSKGAAEEQEEKSVRQRKGGKKDEEKNGKKDEKEKKGKKNDEKESEMSKAKRKYKLDIHEEQEFNDSSDLYVWDYSPAKPWYYLIGIVLVVGGLVMSLFPVWPSQGRVVVWYLSMAGLGLLGLFFSVVILRHIIFGFVWLFTHGTHHFWLLPNLTEDVSFFDSFKPSYSFEYCGDEEQTEEEEEEKQEDEVEDETGEGEEQEKGTEKGDESESQLSEGRTGEESRTEDDTTDG